MIRFSKYIWLYVLLSSLIVVPGMYSLIRWGLRPSIDFTGGTLLEVRLQKSVSKKDIDTMAQKDSIDLIETNLTGKSDYSFRMKTVSDSAINAFQQDLAKASGENINVLRKDTVGPVIGKELLGKAVIASIVAICAILLYVAYAFKDFKFGVSAVMALLHDMLIMFATFSLFGHFFGVEVDTLFVTAFLTTMSFSVHDTIVIFDRIREYRHKDTRSRLADVSDIALTETMGRSLVNSFTIIFMLLSLVLIGGVTVRWFAAALLIGTITGTYSSPFIATPFLLLLEKLKQKK